jgi:hypothetical protein
MCTVIMPEIERGDAFSQNSTLVYVKRSKLRRAPPREPRWKEYLRDLSYRRLPRENISFDIAIRRLAFSRRAS